MVEGAFGRRINCVAAFGGAKHVFSQNGDLVKSTYYVLDAQGNQLSTYEHKPSEPPYELAERVVYGSSRLGILAKKVDMLLENPEDVLSLYLGEKLYEMSNHLGNVLTVINDIKVPYLDGSDLAYYATVVSTADYSPFGVQLDGRTESAESYRYGFNGMEKDDEMKGAGNSYTTEFRQYNPRLGRWLSLDPKMAKYPYQSPYASFNNNPLFWIDPFGDDPPPGYAWNHMGAPKLNPFEYRDDLNQKNDNTNRKCYLNNKFTQHFGQFRRINKSNIYALQKQKSIEYYALYYVPEIRKLSDGSEIEGSSGDYVMRRCESTHHTIQMNYDFVQRASGLDSEKFVEVSRMTDPKYLDHEQLSFVTDEIEREITIQTDDFLSENQNIDLKSVKITKLIVHVNGDLPKDYKEAIIRQIENKFDGINISFREISSQNMGNTKVLKTFSSIEYDSFDEIQCE